MSKQERRVASVVIVGGGIGGIAVAMKLARVPVELTLVDARKKRLLRRGFRYGAAQESNLPSVGLPRLTGFEDRLGHRARAAPLQP